MGAVAYTSTIARRRQYLKETAREQVEMKRSSAKEVEECRNILAEWGYNADELDKMTKLIASNPKAMLEFMMSFELKLAPIEKKEARRSFAVVLSSTIFGSIIPLIPFLFVPQARSQSAPWPPSLSVGLSCSSSAPTWHISRWAPYGGVDSK